MSLQKIKFDRISSSEEKTHFFEKLASFKPIKFTMFLDGQNYIFTPYCPIHYSAIIIFEDENQNELHVDGCTCGYVGHGPNDTVEVLKFLGMTNEEAQNLAHNFPSIRFKIDRDLKCITKSIETDAFFETRHHELKAGQVFLKDNIIVNVELKEIFIFDVQDNISALMRILDKIEKMKMALYSVEYYIGKQSTERRNFYFPNVFLKHNNAGKENGPFLSIHTDKVDVTCFVPEQYAVSVINVVNHLVIGKRMFNTSLYQICQEADAQIDLPTSLISQFIQSVKLLRTCSRAKEFYRRISTDGKRGVYFKHEHNLFE